MLRCNRSGEAPPPLCLSGKIAAAVMKMSKIFSMFLPGSKLAAKELAARKQAAREAEEACRRYRMLLLGFSGAVGTALVVAGALLTLLWIRKAKRRQAAVGAMALGNERTGLVTAEHQESEVRYVPPAKFEVKSPPRPQVTPPPTSQMTPGQLSFDWPPRGRRRGGGGEGIAISPSPPPPLLLLLFCRKV